MTTISFASTTGFDESPLAYTMARRYNTNHIVAKDTEVNIVDLLFKMQEIFDEPFADPAAISAYVVAKEARKHVKVILSGDAGDEVLGDIPQSIEAYIMPSKCVIVQCPLVCGKLCLICHIYHKD